MINFKIVEKIPIKKFLSSKVIDNFQNMLNLDPNSPDYHIRSSFIIFLLTFIMYVLYTIKSNIIPAVLFAVVVALLYHLNFDKINQYIDLSNIQKSIAKLGDFINLDSLNISNFTNNLLPNQSTPPSNQPSLQSNKKEKNLVHLNINKIKPNIENLDNKNKQISNELKNSLNKMNKIK